MSQNLASYIVSDSPPKPKGFGSPSLSLMNSLDNSGTNMKTVILKQRKRGKVYETLEFGSPGEIRTPVDGCLQEEAPARVPSSKARHSRDV